MRARHGITAGALLGASLFAVPVTAQAHVAEPDSTPQARVQAVDTVEVKPPAPVPRRVPAPRVWVVRPNDTLTGIGVKFDRTWAQLAAWNHIPNPNLILVGQKLQIPPASFVPPPISLPAPPPVNTPTPVYRAPAYPAPSRTYSAPVRHYYSYTAPAPSGGGSFTGVWACIAQHESGGNPAENTGNGYYGGLQFTIGTWQANGGTGNPANASAAEQERVANNVVANAGGSYGAWPNTSQMCGV